MKVKQLIAIMILMFIPLFMMGCGGSKEETQDNLLVLPDLTDMSREEIVEVMENLDIEYYFGFSAVPCYKESDYDKFVEYGSGLEIGDTVDKSKQLYILTTPLHIVKKDISLLKLCP